MKNKKGLFLTFSMFIVLVILALIALLAFFIFPSVKFTVIGISFFIGAIYLGGQILASKNQNKLGTKLLIPLFLVGVGIFFIFGSGLIQQTFFSSEVYLPEYASIWCGTCDIGVQTSIYEIKDSNIRAFKCENGYIPKGCNIEISVPGGVGERAVYVCDKSVSSSKVFQELKDETSFGKSGESINGCIKYGDSSFESDNTKDFKITQNQYLYLLTEEFTTRAKYDYDPFCLRTLERGQLSSFSSCSSNELFKNVKDAPIDIPSIIPSGKENHIEHIVIGYSGVVNSVDVINPSTFLRLQYGNIQSCNINTGNDFKSYVDLESCKTDNKYICLPSLPPAGSICEGGIKLIPIKKDSECSGSGFIGNRVIDNQNCEVHCVNGKIEIKNCVNIVVPIIPQPSTCGDGICQSNEDKTNCPNDCQDKLTCNPVFQVLKTKIDKDYGFLYWRALIGKPKVTETEYCATAGWVYAVITGVVVIILAIIILKLNKPIKRRR